MTYDPDIPHSELRNGGGPKTAEGKKRSSLNALKHGLIAKSPHVLEVVAEQFYVPFEPILDEMRRHYYPTNPVEERLVNRIARCMWRLARTESMEDRLLERNPGATRPGTSIEKVAKYERMVDLQLHRAIASEAKRGPQVLE
jgi:hypothetical protein